MTLSKKVKILLLVVSLSLTLSFMSNTYSRYVADTTGNLEIQFAKWQILVNESDITNQTESSIELTPVIEENENIAVNTIAPSSKGYFDIDIDPSNVGVSFEYDITLDVLNENMPDLMITKYSVLDSDYVEGEKLEILTISENGITGSLTYGNATEEETTEEPVTEGTTEDETTTEDGVTEETTIEGTEETETFTFKPFTIRIYFEWYEGENEQMDDAADTLVANDAAVNDTKLQVEAKIQFKQKL